MLEYKCMHLFLKTKYIFKYKCMHFNARGYDIIIYHHLCHHPKRGWVTFRHRFYTCLYSSAKYIHLYILIYFQDIDTVAVYKYAYK